MLIAAAMILLVGATFHVSAEPNPNSPGPGDVFVQGKQCTISWDADPTGLWKTMNIDLMSGDNFDMVSLTPVGTVDGTNPSKNTYSYACPEVSPHSPIYFYQFSSPATSNKTWTGRFAITDSTGTVVAPSQSTQPDGMKIPWGTGSLVKGSSAAVKALASGSDTSVATSSTGGEHSTSSSSAPSGTSLTNRSLTTSVVSQTSSTTTTTTTTHSTASATGTNGAVTLLTMSPASVSGLLFRTGCVLGLAAFGFAVVF